MTHNIGTADRVARIVLGLFLLSLPFWMAGDIRWFGLIGIVPLTTALLRWCPLYTVFGIRTCGRG